MTTTIPAIREASYRKWLLALPEQGDPENDQEVDATYVGETLSGQSCPLAVWLWAQGVPSVYVSKDEVGTIFQPVRRLPEWARIFTRLIDNLPRYQPVTREQALSVLENVDSLKGVGYV